jgi:alpha-beta hydrolase superfamily lysophospholipase
MKTTLQRITTKDGLELQGLLFEPDKKTAKALIHVHAWVGNFYENNFINYIAEAAVAQGFAFLTFNNRGAGFVTDFIKRNRSGFKYVRIGGASEKFEDCVLDISAVLDFLEKRGYKSFVLQGHSTGCQKATYYKFKTKNKKVCGLVELSPADDVAYVKKLLGGKYREALNIAKKMVSSGKSGEPVPAWMAFYPSLSAKTFLNIADPKSVSAKIFDYIGELKEIKNVECPVLAISGSRDEYQDNPEGKLEILKNQVANCSTKFMINSDHWFTNYEKQLAKLIGNWLQNL